MPFVGLHIHKTAGTSLLRYLEQHAPYRLYGAYALRNFRLLELPLWASHNHTSRDIFWGHAIYESFFYESITPVQLYTFLRDPVERILSWYSMLKRRKKLKKSAQSLESFVENHENSICKMLISRFPSLVKDKSSPLSDQALSILDHMGFVGFQSQYSHHLCLMLEWMQVPISAETLAARHNIAKKPKDFDASAYQMIQAQNVEDICFYEKAYQRYADNPLNTERKVRFKSIIAETGQDLAAIKTEQTQRAQKKFVSSLRFSLGDVGLESYLHSLSASFSQCDKLMSKVLDTSSKD